MLLVDPARASLLVRYDPSRPTIAQWRERYPRALAIVNGPFYSADGEVRPTCDLVSAGKAVRGAGCHVKDALFFGAQPRIDVLSATPVSRDPPPRPRFVSPPEFKPDAWLEAFKSFPALVRAGAPGCMGTSRYCAESSRTAAVAMMKDGRILLFASQWPAVRRDVAKWLAEQLGAVDALNLDGGPEATMALRGETPQESIGGHSVGLPIVLVVVPVTAP